MGRFFWIKLQMSLSRTGRLVSRTVVVKYRRVRELEKLLFKGLYRKPYSSR